LGPDISAALCSVTRDATRGTTGKGFMKIENTSRSETDNAKLVERTWCFPAKGNGCREMIRWLPKPVTRCCDRSARTSLPVIRLCSRQKSWFCLAALS